MPRLAGDDPGYTFRIMRKGPGGTLTASPHGFELDSVTTIIGAVIPKPFSAGAWYGYRIGLEGVADLWRKKPGNTSGFAKAEELEARIRELGHDPNANLEGARGRGYIAHDVLELLAGGEEDIALGVCLVEEDIYGTRYGWGVFDWWTNQKPEFQKSVVSERPVWSLRLGYAGTTDLLVPEKEILDLKTHKPAVGFTKPGQGPAYLSDLLQLRAYSLAWEHMGNAPLQGSRVIVVRSNGKYLEDTRQVPEELWLKTLEMYELMKSV